MNRPIAYSFLALLIFLFPIYAQTKGQAICIAPWSGPDPYGLDWSGANLKLYPAFQALDCQWQLRGHAPLKVLQAYRPQAYQDHIQSVWDAWRFVHGLPVYDQCHKAMVYPPKNWRTYAADSKFMSQLASEVAKHGATGDTRPACVSDHMRGLAIDIDVSNIQNLQELIDTAAQYGLTHPIKSDEPHFVLETKQKKTDSFLSVLIFNVGTLYPTLEQPNLSSPLFFSFGSSAP